MAIFGAQSIPDLFIRPLEEAILFITGTKATSTEARIPPPLEPIQSTPPEAPRASAKRPNDTISAAQKRLTQLRIDVVAFRSETDADVIEVKGRAMPGSVGEILIYTILWRLKHPGIRARPVIVANNIHPDVCRIATAYGITCIEV